MKPHRQRRGPEGSRRSRGDREVRVLYEDDAVIAVDKPAGLAAVPVVKGTKAPSALALVAAELKTQRQRVSVVHRIDRFTSGILLFAKTQRDRDALIKQFLAHQPAREYLAVVRGEVKPSQGTLVQYFRKEGMFQKLSSPRDKKAARAELQYIVEQKLKGASLIRVKLQTGLQNQIRVQFSAVGHPVVGDRKYHPEEEKERRIDRVALHASHLEFNHPRTGKSVKIDSQPPQDFENLVRALAIQAR
jgi:23S rRNA pseudouridine1911/1915/1917 synthase